MPEPKVWTVFIDGSAVPNPGRMSIGGVLYAPDGTVVQFSRPLHRTGCNNEAEALAAIHALQWLIEQQADAVLLHTDSSILAEQLSLPTPKPVVRLAAIYEEVRAVFRQFSSAQVKWIPRHKNTLADALARADSANVETASAH